MSHLGPSMPTSQPTAWRLVLLMLVRMSVSIAALLLTYFLLPARGSGPGSDLPWLVLELAIFGVIVGVQVPAIVKAKYPVLRAIEALAILIPLFILIFARLYLSTSLSNPAAFNEPLNKPGALYFTVTVFATLGFGDIVPKTTSMRMVVSVQMLLDLALLGLVIRLLTASARKGIERKGGTSELAGPGSGAPDLGTPGHLGDVP